MNQSKWSGAYWNDLLERVGSTLVYSIITLLTTVQVADLGFEQLWPVLVLPTVLSFLKGIAANLPAPQPSPSGPVTSGASLLPPSSGPVVVGEVVSGGRNGV